MAEQAPPPTSQQSNNKARRLRGLSSTQVMFAVILAIGLILAFQFSSRITAERDLSQFRATVEEEIVSLQREQSDLIDELAFVESDAYVETWAHREGRMVREGEVLIIPIPSEISIAQQNQSNTDTQNPTIETTIPQPDNWELWWALFFDSPPPQIGD